MDKLKLASLLLRIGIAFVFLYAVVAATLQPDNWIVFLPQFMTKIIPANTLMMMFSAYEAVIAIWLLSRKKVVYPAILSGLTMAGIIVFNLYVFDITFRDVAILFAAAALAVLEK